MNKKLYGEIGEITSLILSSYKDDPHTVHLDDGSLPNRNEIIDIIKMLREILFPGYFGKQNLKTPILEYHTGDLIMNIYEKLHKQLCDVFRNHANKNVEAAIDPEAAADEVINKFLHKIPEIRRILSTDLDAAFEGDPAANDKGEIIFSYPGFFAIIIYRLAHEFYILSVPLIPRIMTEYAHSLTGIDIHPGAEIGAHFFVDHGTGVVIGESSKIGNNVRIYQGVTLGAISTREGQALKGAKRHPILEDDVIVYSGASILGGETVIGKGVVIGGNVFITRSVPDKTKVSVKNPELMFKGQLPQEFKQDFILDWTI